MKEKKEKAIHRKSFASKVHVDIKGIAKLSIDNSNDSDSSWEMKRNISISRKRHVVALKTRKISIRNITINGKRQKCNLKAVSNQFLGKNKSSSMKSPEGLISLSGKSSSVKEFGRGLVFAKRF